MTTSTQNCFHTFDVVRDGERLPVYVYRHAIGDDEFSYSVKRGDAGMGTKGETIAKGFDSRKLAVDWINRNV
jgi:hypothetical protein